MPRTRPHRALHRLDHGVLLPLEPVDEQRQRARRRCRAPPRTASGRAACRARPNSSRQAQHRQRVAAQVQQLAPVAALDLAGLDEQRLAHASPAGSRSARRPTPTTSAWMIASVIGSVSVTVVPRPGVESTPTTPPSAGHVGAHHVHAHAAAAGLGDLARASRSPGAKTRSSTSLRESCVVGVDQAALDRARAHARRRRCRARRRAPRSRRRCRAASPRSGSAPSRRLARPRCAPRRDSMAWSKALRTTCISGSTSSSTISLSSSVSAPRSSRRTSLSRSRRSRRTTRVSFSKTWRSGTMRTSSTRGLQLLRSCGRAPCGSCRARRRRAPCRGLAGEPARERARARRAAITSSPTRFISSSSLRMSTRTVSLRATSAWRPRPRRRRLGGPRRRRAGAAPRCAAAARPRAARAARTAAASSSRRAAQLARRRGRSPPAARSGSATRCAAPGEGSVESTSPTSRIAPRELGRATPRRRRGRRSASIT